MFLCRLDENYAREIMQLFSIGLYKLNNDGTKQLDGSGSPILSYDNTDIQNFARAWTGFTRQSARANIESIYWDNTNRIDPMNIVGKYIIFLYNVFKYCIFHYNNRHLLQMIGNRRATRSISKDEPTWWVHRR